MKGTITLYSRKGEIIIRCFYKRSEDRWMLMRSWTETYDPLGYYFIVSPQLIEEKMERKRTYVKRLPQKAPVIFIRPKAVYDNHTHYGIADELHSKNK